MKKQKIIDAILFFNELNVYKKEEIEKMMNEGYLFDGEKMVQLKWNYYPKYKHILEEGKLYKNIFK